MLEKTEEILEYTEEFIKTHPSKEKVELCTYGYLDKL